MRVLYHLSTNDLKNIPQEARWAEDMGYDGLSVEETAHDRFSALMLAANTTSRVTLETRVAIAFPRSPMVVAHSARDLQDFSGGRFRLGLGTQVKGHMERRFSVPWVSPGPRLREYVQALHAIWDTWQDGTRLDFQGRFYTFNLMTPFFSPGAWANWDTFFNSSHDDRRVELEGDEVVVVSYENNDFYRLIDREPVSAESRYWFDEQGRILGRVYLGPTGETEDRLDEFTAWLEACDAQMLAWLMPEGEIEPTVERANRWKELLIEWRREMGLPEVELAGVSH